MRTKMFCCALLCLIFSNLLIAGGNKKKVETYNYSMTVDRYTLVNYIEPLETIPHGIFDFNINLSLSPVTVLEDCGEWTWVNVVCDTCEEKPEPQYVWVSNWMYVTHYPECTVTVNVYSDANGSTLIDSRSHRVTTASPWVTSYQFESPSGSSYRIEYIMSDGNFGCPSANFANNQIVFSITE